MIDMTRLDMPGIHPHSQPASAASAAGARRTLVVTVLASLAASAALFLVV